MSILLVAVLFFLLLGGLPWCAAPFDHLHANMRARFSFAQTAIALHPVRVELLP